MTIINKSGKIIGVDGRAILPGETGTIPDSYKTNGILEMLSKDPDLTIEQAEDSRPRRKRQNPQYRQQRQMRRDDRPGSLPHDGCGVRAGPG